MSFDKRDHDMIIYHCFSTIVAVYQEGGEGWKGVGLEKESIDIAS
jgi:hypothetical protein